MTEKKMNRNTVSFKKVNSWLSAVYSQSSEVHFLPIDRVMFRFDENGEKILLKDYYHIDMIYSQGFLEKNGIVEINSKDKTIKWVATDSVENLTELLKTVAKQKKDESKERTRKRKLGETNNISIIDEVVEDTVEDKSTPVEEPKYKKNPMNRVMKEFGKLKAQNMVLENQNKILNNNIAKLFDILDEINVKVTNLETKKKTYKLLELVNEDNGQ